MSAADRRDLTPHQELALRFLAYAERTTLAEQRRRAIRARADEALEDPDVREAVKAAIECQIERAIERLTDEPV